MRKLFFAALTLGLSVTACVNQDYDLKKFDKSVTLFEEGICEIPLQDAKISTSELLGDNDRPFGQDNIVNSNAEKVEVNIEGVKEADLENGVPIDKVVNIQIDGLPDYLTNEKSYLIFPEEAIKVNFNLQNPTDLAVNVFADIYADEVLILKGEKIGAFAAGEINKSIVIDLSKKLNHYPGNVQVKNFVLQMPKTTKSGIETRKTDASNLIERTFYVASTLTFAGILLSGSKISTEMTLTRNIIDALGFKEDLKKYDVESFVLSGKAKNTIPMRVKATSTGDLVATLNYEYDPANKPDRETGEFTLDASTPNGLDNIKEFKATVFVEILPFPKSLGKLIATIADFFFDLECYTVRPKGVNIGEE